MQDLATFEVAAEQPYTYRLTGLGVEAERRGKGLEFAYWSGTQSETVADVAFDIAGKTAGSATPFLSADWDHVVGRTGMQVAYGLAETKSGDNVTNGIGQARDTFTITAGSISIWVSAKCVWKANRI